MSQVSTSWFHSLFYLYISAFLGHSESIMDEEKQLAVGNLKSGPKVGPMALRTGPLNICENIILVYSSGSTDFASMLIDTELNTAES